jgi:uncharacterized protein (TIGR02246 family)
MGTLRALLVALLVSGCASSPPGVSVEDETATLMRLSREWSEVAASGDLERTLAYWADDAVMMIPGQPPIRGKEAIRKFVESSAAVPGFSVRWEPLEAHVSASGDMAYLIERNQFSFNDSSGALVTESNKVLTVWRKQDDGTWKNVIDMWNADPGAWK